MNDAAIDLPPKSAPRQITPPDDAGSIAMPSKDALAYEVSLDLTAQELLALPVPSRMEGGDDICDGARGLRARQDGAAASSDGSLEIELTAEEMLNLLVGDEVIR